MDKILGYYDYYNDKYEYTRYGNGKTTTRIDKQPNDIERFFANDSICPFCKNKLKLVFIGNRSVPRETDLYLSGQVLECSNCGWWTYKTHFADEVDSVDEVWGSYIDERYYAITKSFNIDDKLLPIEVLNMELKKRPEILYRINPYKLEELSQSILKDVYDCEVHHVGQRGDGGKDLIILESDNPILVQVKCRQNPEHVELVQGIREFVGTLFIEDVKRGIYISTAKRFSKSSVDVIDRLLVNRKLDFFEFVNYDKLQALIKKTEEKKVWKKLVGYFYEHKDAGVYDNDNAIKEYFNECKRYEKMSAQLFSDKL